MKRILDGLMLAGAMAVAFTARSEWKCAPCTMVTTWGEKITPANAWREYPRPQLVRPDWTNLNGLWLYAVTPKAVDAMAFPTAWDGEILVPFALEAPLSGVGRLLKPDEMLWYRRTITVKKRAGERVLLHFGGVDFRAQVFIGHREVTDVPHEGGLVPFTLDITPYVVDGDNELTLATWDPTTDYVGATGKQVFNPGGCMYTRMSGIWQTVWLERVPETHITGYRTSKVDLANGKVTLHVDGVESPSDRRAGAKGLAVAKFAGREVGRAEFLFGEPVEIALTKPVKVWSPDAPALYDLELVYGLDRATGYFAMRTFEKRRDVNGIWRFFLNGEPQFIQGPLDQGWWPDGLLTPPSEEAMKFDIQTLKDLGCNMMRKHIKVEPARYYRLCDELGMMVLQDMASGGGEPNKRYGFYRREFKDVVDALRVFPSIVMWVPYNEGWAQPGEFLTHCTLDWVKRYDPERLVNGPSGWNDFEGGGGKGSNKHKPEGECEAADAVDYHSYRGPAMPAVNERRVSFLGEFGGLGHPVAGHLWKENGGNWGYGGTKDTGTPEGLESVYLGLMKRLTGFARQGLGGSVYTQTTDVELELNGYLTYDRKVLKYRKDVLREAHERVYDAAYKAAKFKTVGTEVFGRYGEWSYTFDRPTDGWEKPGFAASGWLRGKAGFGTHINDASKIETKWSTREIWLRRAFTVKTLGDAQNAVLELFHDEDTEVYLNGVKVLSTTGYNTSYEPFELDWDVFKKAIKIGENTIAAHVRQTQGGQYFDAALKLVRFVEP